MCPLSAPVIFFFILINQVTILELNERDTHLLTLHTLRQSFDWPLISILTSQPQEGTGTVLFGISGVNTVGLTDNEPQFSSHLFKEFAEEWNFAHHTSSPTKPYSNGQAESAVKIIKGLLTNLSVQEKIHISHSWLTEVHLFIHI